MPLTLGCLHTQQARKEHTRKLQVAPTQLIVADVGEHVQQGVAGGAAGRALAACGAWHRGVQPVWTVCP